MVLKISQHHQMPSDLFLAFRKEGKTWGNLHLGLRGEYLEIITCLETSEICGGKLENPSDYSNKTTVHLQHQ